ncbi:putative monooxygenase [Sphaerulina musiva]
MTGKQLTLFITFKIQPDRIEEWKEAHRPVWAETAAEPECLSMDIFQDPKNPGTFRFVETWAKDREWFEKEQFTKPYYATLWPKSQPTWSAPVEVEFFERSGDGDLHREKYLAKSRSEKW